MIEAPPLIQTKVQLPEVPKVPEITIQSENEKEKQLIISIISELFDQKNEMDELKVQNMNLEITIRNIKRAFELAYKQEFGENFPGPMNRIQKEMFG